MNTMNTMKQYPNTYNLFKAAAKNSKYPKLKLNLPSGRQLLLRLVQSGKYPNTITISNGLAFADPNNVFYGRILETTDLIKSTYATAEAREEVFNTLDKIEAGVIDYALSYSKTTCTCMFCNRLLTTKESTTVGYGPICADTWGLPWGASTELLDL